MDEQTDGLTKGNPISPFRNFDATGDNDMVLKKSAEEPEKQDSYTNPDSRALQIFNFLRINMDKYRYIGFFSNLY